MELTREEAIRIAIELWTWLAKTGRHKYEWLGWRKYGRVNSDCPLCEYSHKEWRKKSPEGGVCTCCPYWQKFRTCHASGKPFDRWANVVRPKTRKKYAALFLEQLKQL